MPFPVYVVVSIAIAAGTMAATARLSDNRRFAVLAIVVGASGLSLFHGLGYYHFSLPLDDAYITLRYSRHLADGLGPNWNSEGHVEGYTSFLWMGTLAGLAKLGADLVVAVRVLNILAIFATFGIVVGIWKLWADESPGSGVDSPLVPAASLLALALSDALGFWGFSGMETPMFMALLSGSALLFLRERRTGGIPWSAVALAATAMTRPEGVVVAAVTGAFVLYDGWRAEERRQALARAVLWGSLFLILYGAYFFWRYTYYDYLFPNTYYAKVGATMAIYNRGLGYVFQSGLQYQMLAMLSGAGLLLAIATERLRRDAAYLIALCGALLLTIVFEGGEAFPHNRFILPLLPILYLTGLTGFAMILKRLALAPKQGALVAATVLSLGGLSLLASTQDVNLNHSSSDAQRALGIWLNEHTPKDFKIAVFAAGAVSYYAHEREIVDLFGLNDVTIAHTDIDNFGEGLAGHEKYNYDYVLGEVRPEIIIFGADDWVPRTLESVRLTEQTAGGVAARVNLVRDPRLYENYEFRWLVRDGYWFNLLQRKDTFSELHGPGLLGDQNSLPDPANPASWVAWHSQLVAGVDGFVSSSLQAAYGPYTSTRDTGVQTEQGQTYVALVWVRGTETSTGDQISVSLRENGIHSPESETNSFFLLSDKWQPIAVTRTIQGRDTTFLSIHMLKFSSIPKADSFLFRDAQIALVSE